MIDEFVFQSNGRVDHAMRSAGSAEAWQNEIAALASGNTRLVLALSTAFAAPLIYLVGAESGGFHFCGGSSTGKSTALAVAGSAWGGGGIRGYMRTWRATSNGLEGIAVQHCDALLCLDEMGQVDGSEAGAIAYMLANGVGKQRAGRAGEARPPAEWRLLFLSTGEIGLSDKMAEDGRGRRVAAGQEVRIVDIEADAACGLGLFENLHGFADGDIFARHLKASAAKHYGHASRAFLRALVNDLDEIVPTLKRSVDRFVAEQCPEKVDGQVSRVCGRFGLVAAAGEMATALDILPWRPDEAKNAAARCFQDWLGVRGGAEPAEDRQAIAQVRRFIEKYGTSRFEAIGNVSSEAESVLLVNRHILNRVGFRRRAEDGGIEYIILPEVWKSEVCIGLNSASVVKTLVARNLMIIGSDGKAQVKVRVPIAPNPVRAYIVTAGILDGAQE